MNVYLFRHGIALDIGQNGITSDDQRPLSDEGMKKTGNIAQALKKIRCNPTRIVTSPLIRARQTADIAARVLCPDTTPEPNGVMAPFVSAEETGNWLTEQDPEDIMLVGHNPHMEQLASYLISGSDDIEIRLKKASICRIAFDEEVQSGCGMLEWLMQPAQLLGL